MARAATPRKTTKPAARKTAKRPAAKRAAPARKAATRKPAARKPATRKATTGKPASGRWSQRVTETSDAMDLEEGVFKKRSARAIAISLKHSVERSDRRKGTPFQSAMSMLTFEINRAGKNLSAERKRILEGAKDELRKAFGRE